MNRKKPLSYRRCTSENGMKTQKKKKLNKSKDIVALCRPIRVHPSWKWEWQSAYKSSARENEGGGGEKKRWSASFLKRLHSRASYCARGVCAKVIEVGLLFVFFLFFFFFSFFLKSHCIYASVPLWPPVAGLLFWAIGLGLFMRENNEKEKKLCIPLFISLPSI